MKFQKPTGTTDFYPEDLEIRNKIFDSLRNTAKRFGFQEVETPAFETMGLLTAKSGEEIKKQIFVLEKKGDEEFGLRFDLTVPITRMFLEKQKELAKPVKWFGLSRMWRYERPQAGRLREFYQLSVEMFGSSKPEADAEIINLAITCLKDLGLTNKDFNVKINNRKLLQGILEQFADKRYMDQLIALVDKKGKIEPKEFDKGLSDFKVKDPEKLKKILETGDIEKLEVENELAKQGLEELKQVMSFLNKKFLKFDLTTARGLAYYTGTVFEIFDTFGKFRAICGGGRYDNMVEQFGGESAPATGFGLGYATLSLLLKEKNLIPKIDLGPEYYAVLIGNVQSKAIPIINKLRKKYTVDYDLTRRNIKNQLDYANKMKAKNVIFIGEKEIWSGKIKIKDMKTGKEKEVKVEDIK